MAKTLITSSIHKATPWGLTDTTKDVMRRNPGMTARAAEQVADKMLALAEQYRLSDGTWIDGWAADALYREAIGRTEAPATVEDLRALGFNVSAPLAAVK